MQGLDRAIAVRGADELRRAIVRPADPTVVDDDAVGSERLAIGAQLAFIVAGAALAVGLRFWAIGAIGLSSDEAVYVGQAGALAGDDALSRFFTPFRAHPLLVQSSLAAVFTVTGVSDLVARLFVAAVFGIGSLVATASMTRRMYGPIAAAVAACVLAVIPYHVVLSRQVMLDLPAVTFLLLAARDVYRSAVEGRRWWFASAVWVGLAVCAKETSILFVMAIVLFLFWSGAFRRLSRRDVLVWAGLFALVVAPFFLSRVVFGGHNTGGYVVYQFLRPPNHPWWYFPVVLWEFVTPPALVLALIGLTAMVRRRTIADKLLLSWIAVFAVFFQAWPTKLFPYAMAATPVIAVAAAVGIQATASAIAASLARRRTLVRSLVTAGLSLVLMGSLVPPAVLAATNSIDQKDGPLDTDVEVQDFAGGREAGQWVRARTPEGSVFLTIGPSVGNILSLYGHREWYALSVSRDPALRNPAYRPLVNPDLAVRRLQTHYAVWDAYSADRSGFYSGMLLRLVRRHGGVPVFSAWMGDGGEVHTGVTAPPGVDVRIVVYDLPGGDPWNVGDSAEVVDS